MGKTKKTVPEDTETKVLTEEELEIQMIREETAKKIAEIKAKRNSGKVIAQINEGIAQLQRLLADPMDVTSVVVQVKIPTKKTYTPIKNVL